MSDVLICLTEGDRKESDALERESDALERE